MPIDEETKLDFIAEVLSSPPVWSLHIDSIDVQVFFCLQLILRMNHAYYMASALVASRGTVADRIMIVTSGRIQVLFSGPVFLVLTK